MSDTPRYFLALSLCTATALLALLVRDWLDPANAAMLLLLVVFLVAVRLGRGPAVATAFASVVLFDVLFVPPYFSLTVANAQHLVIFVVMLAVGLITTHLTAQLAERQGVALASERETRQLYELARDLGAALTVEQAVDRLAAFLHERKLAAAILVNTGTGGAESFITYGRLVLSPAEQERAISAYRQGVPLASETHWLLPFRGATRVRGVFVAAYGDDNRPLLEAVASLTGIVVERLHYAEVAQRSELDAQSEKLRASILASLSHDLRTPLTSLIGLADTLAVECAESKNVGAEATACIVRDQARAMHRMVTNLLEMARLQSGPVRLNRQWQPIDEVVGSSLRQFADGLAARKLRVDLPHDLPLVQIDAVLMERVLCNLLDNAIKYSSAGAEIVIDGRTDGGELRVSVCNEGSGFPPGREDELFAPFVRGDPESTIAGTGIGLAVCQAVVVAHGGHIRAENAAGYACVRLVLPLGTPPTLEGEEGEGA